MNKLALGSVRVRKHYNRRLYVHMFGWIVAINEVRTAMGDYIQMWSIARAMVIWEETDEA